jgi:hypothetical protein
VATAWKTPDGVVVVGAADVVSMVEKLLRLLELEEDVLLFKVVDDEVLTDVLDVVLTDVLVVLDEVDVDVTLRVEVALELDFPLEVLAEEVVRRSTGSPNPYRRTGSGNPYALSRRRNRFCFAASSISRIIFRLTNRCIERAYSNGNDELKSKFRTIGISTTCFPSGRTAVGIIFLP